ncbi:MAG: hypothetical protein WC026_06795 [Hyphomicrobium sp.]|uniref:hypothetical protein n=1 Tax=Hyphomicrobium sp. TaxID=82 RepID=UPI0035697CF2
MLKDKRLLHEGAVVLPTARRKPVSHNTLSKFMRDNDLFGSPHVFKSFKGWAAEQGVRDEVAKAALAHANCDKVRAAYRRTRFLDERRVVMQQGAILSTVVSPTVFS